MDKFNHMQAESREVAIQPAQFFNGRLIVEEDTLILTACGEWIPQAASFEKVVNDINQVVCGYCQRACS